MPDMRKSLLLSCKMEALCGRRHTPGLRGYLMCSPRLCLWFSYFSLRLRLDRYQCFTVLGNRTSFRTMSARPGFLRAGRSRDNLAKFCLCCKHGDTWTWMPSCPGFLLRRDSWHHLQICILSILIQ
jgi:hypothetical protein